MTTVRYTLSLPKPLDLKVKQLARSLGLPVATFIRHLVIEEVRKTSIPTFSMTAQTEKIISQTDQAYKKGKLSSYSSLDDFFKDLERGG